jgi:hypothetical protein
VLGALFGLSAALFSSSCSGSWLASCPCPVRPLGISVLCVYFFSFCQLADHVYELSVAIFYLMKRQYTFHLSSKINEILTPF